MRKESSPYVAQMLRCAQHDKHLWRHEKPIFSIEMVAATDRYIQSRDTHYSIRNTQYEYYRIGPPVRDTPPTSNVNVLTCRSS